MINEEYELIFEAAIDSLRVVYDAEYLKARCSIWIAANTPVMTNKLDEEGNLVKNKVTGEPEKEPLLDEDGNEVYIITMEEAEERLQKIKKSIDNTLELKKPDAKILAAKLEKMNSQTRELAGQLALLPLAIISTTPVGPGFSPNLIKPILTPVIAQGQDLSTMYDEVEKLQKDLQFTQETLTMLENINVSPDDILPKDPNVVKKVILRITDWITTVMAGKVIAIKAIKIAKETKIEVDLALCKTACLSVGVDCGGEKSTVDPTPKTDFVPTPKATECENYDGPYVEQEPEKRDATNCTRFEYIVVPEKPKPSDRTCQNCKYYKKA